MPVQSADSNKRRETRTGDLSDNWIEQFFPSLHKCSPTLFLPTQWQSGYLLFRPLSRPLYPDLFLPSELVTVLPSPLPTKSLVQSKDKFEKFPSFNRSLLERRPICTFTKCARSISTRTFHGSLFATRPRNDQPPN